MADHAAVKPKGFAGLLNATGKYFHDVKVEMGKVVWPTREQVKGYTAVVLASTAFFSIASGIFDRILSAAIKWLLMLIS